MGITTVAFGISVILSACTDVRPFSRDPVVEGQGRIMAYLLRPQPTRRPAHRLVIIFESSERVVLDATPDNVTGTTQVLGAVQLHDLTVAIAAAQLVRFPAGSYSQMFGLPLGEIGILCAGRLQQYAWDGTSASVARLQDPEGFLRAYKQIVELLEEDHGVTAPLEPENAKHMFYDTITVIRRS